MFLCVPAELSNSTFCFPRTCQHFQTISSNSLQCRHPLPVVPGFAFDPAVEVPRQTPLGATLIALHRLSHRRADRRNRRKPVADPSQRASTPCERICSCLFQKVRGAVSNFGSIMMFQEFQHWNPLCTSLHCLGSFWFAVLPGF